MEARMRLVLVYDSNNLRQESNKFQIIQSFHREVNHAITAALEAEGHQVTALVADRELERRLVEIQPDFAFNCSNSSNSSGDRSYAPAVLRKLGIPFTGSPGIACLNAYSKERAKRILKEAGIRTPRAMIVDNGQCASIPNIPKTLSYPLFVKPIKGGCSFGISRQNLITDRAELRQRLPEIYRQVGQPLLLEEFLAGREFTAGVLGNREARVLPIMEFCYPKNGGTRFRSYSLKMVHYEDEEIKCPAELGAGQRDEIRSMAIRTFKAIGCRDYARVDLRMDRTGKLYVLEVNALPNLMPDTSSYAIMAKKAGLSFRELIRSILRTAIERYKRSA